MWQFGSQGVKVLTIDNSQDLTVHDFIKNKEHQPFKRWRTISKTINFGLIFGCTAPTFAGMLKQANFTEAECDEFIQLTNNTQAYNAALANNMGSKHPMKTSDVKFIVVADAMRTSFFETYQGLMGRIKREQVFALAHGYVRSWHGPVRHLAELRYLSVSPKGELQGADRSLYSKMFSHLLNNACNSTVQTMESRIAFATWVNIAKYLALWELKSYCWNNIHDSLDFYIYKPELELVVALANACAAWEREPVKGIHMSFDAEISDVQDYEHRCNTYYKAGVGVDVLPIEEAIEHYNKKNGTDLRWYGNDWLFDRYASNRLSMYEKYCKLNGKENVDEWLERWGGPVINQPAMTTRRVVNG